MWLKARSRNTPATALPQSCTRPAKSGPKHTVLPTGGKTSVIRPSCCLLATSAVIQKTTICDGHASPPSYGDAPLSPSGASHFDKILAAKILERSIDPGYRKRAEFYGFLARRSLIS